MDKIGRIRRLHGRKKKSEREIARTTGLSRNTVSKWLHGEVDGTPKYRRGAQPNKPPASGTTFRQRLHHRYGGAEINAEQGTVTLRHESIAHLHLPATTTTFRYVDPRLGLRTRDGDRVRFRAARYDGTLRLTAAVRWRGQ